MDQPKISVPPIGLTAKYPEVGTGPVSTEIYSDPAFYAKEVEAIFRRLYRGDASRSQRGLGLGLSLVKAIVEAHGGTVAVDDAPGGGAHFIVRLPR